MGGIPETLDAQWASYELVENLKESGRGGKKRNCDAGNYQGYVDVDLKEDGSVKVTVHLMDSQYKYYRWSGNYDESGKLLERSYVAY